MAFNFGSTPTTNAPATGFTLPTNPTTTASTTGFQLGVGSGDNKPQTGATLFKAPSYVSNNSPSSFSALAPPQAKTTAPAFGISTQSTAPAVSLGTSGLFSTATSATPQLNQWTSKASSTTPSLFGSSTATSGTTPTTTATGLSFSTPSSSAPAAKLSFVVPSTTTVASSVPAPTTSTVLAPTSVTSSVSTIPATGSLTFAQLEDSINKWTVDLEEQGKFFVNQAKQLNAWDSLLISDGAKILQLNGGIERVKQQQRQLDQELDFVLAQQRELEELVAPLEKELLEVPVGDIDRNQMYQFSEIIDSQLKQMSDDLKEIIEHINESNKDEETTNPITQISRILNAHMNSLQWIDRNTAQISSHLEQITKIQDSNRRSFSLNNSMTM
ncbi:unnamed protein product [Phaedon cochleariae]|uniref:Nucleoporin NSP1-like C-terminal domain-containing protein n=1 Tax=Phaedon cochleariae TaxID=80249 RepID=A0A9P0DC83_PHACE|nr:unnamed protein product [Phaedon cochleariae]